MLYTAVKMLMVPAVVLAAGGHGATMQECSCAQAEADHPFTIDCNGAAAIRAATNKLETTCSAATSYEWGGVFATPGTAYKWVAQAVGGAYADPAMKIVVFSVDTADKTHLLEKQAAAATLMAGTCTAVSTQGSIPAPTAAGACYSLTFPTNVATDFHATVDTTGVANVAFFGEHVPTEFERDTHYFMSTDLATDIEPVAQTDAKEYNCRVAATGGIKECAQAFFIIQAHHDYCPHDTLTRYEEELFHAWEAKCVGCHIRRKYNSALKSCPVIDCTDTTVASLGYGHLQSTCVKADTTYAYEFAAAFDVPANAYTWVSQAATLNTSLATNYSYADAEMKIIAYTMANNLKSTLFALKDSSDTMMTTGTCPTITASCTPGATTGCTLPTITPTANGACYTIVFPTTNPVAKDFMATIDTTGVAHVGIFTAHMPTEFERDTHYFMSTDLVTDIEPSRTLGAAAAHDHGRRLSQGRRLSEPYGAIAYPNERHSRRRLANPGMCCNTTAQQGAWKQVVSYHDMCHHSQVPTYIEVGFHDYEASCENYFCNLVGPNVNQTVCPYAPPAPPATPPLVATTTGVSSSALIAVIAAAAVVVGLALIFICFMISKEKAGKPVFTDLKATKGGSA